MFNVDLQKVPFTEGILIIVIAACMILPPFWYLFQFEPAIFNKFSLITLAVLSLSITLPVFMLNMAILSTVSEAGESTRDQELDDIFIVTLPNLVIFYGPCLLSYFMHVSSRLALYISTGFEILTIILILVVMKDPASAPKDDSPTPGDHK